MFIDIFDKSLFDTEDPDTSSDRTLRLDDSLSLKYPNWPPFLNTNESMYRINQTTGKYEYNPSAINFNTLINNINSSSTTNLGSFWSIGFNIRNHGTQTTERTIDEVEAVDPVTGDITSYFDVPIFSPPKIVGVPEASCEGCMIIVSLSANNGKLETEPEGLVYNIAANGDDGLVYNLNSPYKWYINETYEQLGIVSTPLLIDGEIEPLGIDVATGEEITIVPYERYPIPVGPITCQTLTVGSSYPIALNAQAGTIQCSTTPLANSSLDCTRILLSHYVMSSEITASNGFISFSASSPTNIAQSTLSASVIRSYDSSARANIIDSTIEGEDLYLISTNIYTSTIECSNFLALKDAVISGTTIQSVGGVESPPVTAGIALDNVLFGNYTTETTTDPDTGITTTKIKEIKNLRTLKGYLNFPLDNLDYTPYMAAMGLVIDNVTIESSTLNIDSMAIKNSDITNTEISCSIFVPEDVTLDNTRADISMFLLDSADTQSQSRNLGGGELRIRNGSKVNLIARKYLNESDCVPAENCACGFNIIVGGGIGDSEPSELIITSEYFVGIRDNQSIVRAGVGGVGIDENYGIVFGNYALVGENKEGGRVQTTNANISINRGFIQGERADVENQYRVEGTEQDITATLTITGENISGPDLKINAKFVGSRAVNNGYCETATYTDGANNYAHNQHATFTNGGTNNVNGGSISMTFLDGGVSIAGIEIYPQQLVISSCRTVSSNIAAQEVICDNYSYVVNDYVRDGTILLSNSTIETDELTDCNIVCEGGSVLEAELGVGNTISMRNSAVLAGAFYNYSLPTNPTGICSGPPNPLANPNLCNPDDNCQGCSSDICWNRDQPAHNKGSIQFFDKSINNAIINRHDFYGMNFSIPEYCIANQLYAADDVSKLVGPQFFDNSKNYNEVWGATFNDNSRSYLSTSYCTFNDNSTCGSNIGGLVASSYGDTFNGGRHSPSYIQAAIVNNGEIILNSNSGHTITKLNGGTIIIKGDGVDLTIREVNGGSIIIDAGTNINLRIIEGNNVTIKASSASNFNTTTISIGHANKINIIGPGQVVLSLSGDVTQLLISRESVVEIDPRDLSGSFRNINNIINKGVLMLPIFTTPGFGGVYGSFYTISNCDNYGVVYQQGPMGVCVTGPGLNLCFPIFGLWNESTCNGCSEHVGSSTYYCISDYRDIIISIFGSLYDSPLSGNTLWPTTVGKYLNVNGYLSNTC